MFHNLILRTLFFDQVRDVSDENKLEACNSVPSPDDKLQPTEAETPQVVFSIELPRGDVLTEKKDEECSDDCESFVPADLLSLAWQIAKGMVRYKCLYRRPETKVLVPCSLAVTI